MAKIIWSPQSLDDLESIADYIARDSRHYAKLVVEKITHAVELLALFPLQGRKVPEAYDENVREIFYKRYRIIYEVKSDRVEILTIIHGSRILNWPL